MSEALAVATSGALPWVSAKRTAAARVHDDTEMPTPATATRSNTNASVQRSSPHLTRALGQHPRQHVVKPQIRVLVGKFLIATKSCGVSTGSELATIQRSPLLTRARTAADPRSLRDPEIPA